MKDSPGRRRQRKVFPEQVIEIELDQPMHRRTFTLIRSCLSLRLEYRHSPIQPGDREPGQYTGRLSRQALIHHCKALVIGRRRILIHLYFK